MDILENGFFTIHSDVTCSPLLGQHQNQSNLDDEPSLESHENLGEITDTSYPNVSCNVNDDGTFLFQIFN